MPIHHLPKVLFFDVFGTVVDWRSTITRTLISHCQNSLASNEKEIPAHTRQTASSLRDADWHTFSQQWRASYINFVRDFDPSQSDFQTVDEHHYSSLKSLLAEWHLQDLWSESEIKSLSLQWHFLDPWPDSSPGLAELNKKFITATLSNGNAALLSDLTRHALLPFQHVLSAEQFKAYKPSPLVYNGAAAKLGLETGDCALVAAHLGDLKAAKACGYQTIYVARRGEEGYSAEEVAKARADGWPDVWIEEDQNGFVELSRILAEYT